MDSGSTPGNLSRHVALRGLGALVAVALLVMSVHAADSAAHASWVPAAALEAPDGVRRAVNAAVAAGIGTIVAPAPLYADTGPDRFLDLLQQAHDHRLLVYASIDVDRVALADEVPAARNHVVYQHPDWLMVPRALAPELLAIDVRSPQYTGRLARWTRANGVDGLYLSPALDDAAAFVASRAAEALKRYAVDGVQLDAARYPAEDFDYGRRAVEAFRRDIRPTLASADRARVDSDETIDPFAYPNDFPDAWRQFRQARLTSLVERVRHSITATLPNVPVVVAISGAADADLRNHLQDWRSWIERRLVDAVAMRSGATTTIVSDASTLIAAADDTSRAGSR